jgi:DNA polymerase I-like protein with 3'-5' exonuclease and polymerase domains
MKVLEKKYITVNSAETVEQLLSHITNYEILAIDTETTGLNVRKEKIIGWSICGVPGESYYLPTWKWNTETEQLDELYIETSTGHKKSSELISKKIIERLKGKKLVAHNASFDFRIIRNYYGIDLFDSIWVDTGMLVHTVQEEGAFGYGSAFALKSIAVMNQEAIGLDVETAANEEQLKLKESVAKNGGSTAKTNFEIYKADLDILCEYGAADTDLTLRICNLYLKKLYEEGLEKFFFEDEVMPIYREVTIPMEDVGVKLDIELLLKTDEDITIDLAKCKKHVIDSIMSLDAGKKWLIDKSITEFPPSNKGSWAQELCELYSIDLPKTNSGKYSITTKNIQKLEDSIIKTFLLKGDLEALDLTSVGEVCRRLWEKSNNGDPINIQSTTHLADLVFNFLGETAKDQTASGKDKFDIEVIESLSDKYDWAESLRVYNKLLKIKSTYIDRFLNNHDGGKYYPYFKQNGTVSGRYGSDLQQLPKPKEEGEDVEIVVHYTNLVRAFFIASEGCRFVDTDYASLEPRVFAHVARDPGLKEIFTNDLDFYSHIAIQTEKLEGVSAHTKAPNFLKKVNPVKRQQAKAYSLGVPYGMTGYALAMSIGVGRKEGEALVDGYLNGFPELKKWMETSRDFVRKNGYIRNMVGRTRHLPLVKRIYEKMGDNLLDYKFRKSLENSYGTEKVQKLYLDYKNGLNNSLNFQIQSLSASIVNRAALNINRRFKKEGIDGIVVAQIHDQLICEVRLEDVEKSKPIIQDYMENTTKLDGVPLIAIPEVGFNMRDAH